MDPRAVLRDRTLVLHIGLHKTATTYLQNTLTLGRERLLEYGVLYPRTGEPTGARELTREGAQSGQAQFTTPAAQPELIAQLAREIPEGVQTVVLSSEDFTLPRDTPTPEQLLGRFAAFGRVEVVLVLRRQDHWVESWYKQRVDQYGGFETRSFSRFLEEEGPRVLDFHARFAPWREAVGPRHFHALSYDDLPGGRELCHRVLDLAGVPQPVQAQVAVGDVARYPSVRSIDTVGLRLLNTYRLADRDARIAAAREIYTLAPDGDVPLLRSEQRARVLGECARGNELIQAEWFEEPAPRFLSRVVEDEPHAHPTGEELLRYVDDVVRVCEAARRHSRRRAARARERSMETRRRPRRWGALLTRRGR